MEIYRLPIFCPKCGEEAVVETIGVTSIWQLVVNFDCTECGHGGSVVLDFPELVEYCKQEEGEEANLQ